MKRKIPRSLLGQSAPDADTTPRTPEMPRTSGAGSAWKSGALAQTQTVLDQARTQLVEDILSGRHELSIPPAQISDPLGTDRREDWQDQEAFQALLSSIEANGQDTPVLVWPEDPDWRPDPLDPTNVSGVPFWMLTGRRRHAAATRLGRNLRAVLGPNTGRDGSEGTFAMLFLRFRENEERENLSAFERLVSIGEMYDALSRNPGQGKVTATAFADRIGVHESLVSRARSVFGARDEILNAFKNVYDMSFRDLQVAMASLNETKKPPPKHKPKKVEVTRKVGHRKISVATQNGALSIKAAGLALNKEALERLGDTVAGFLAEELNGPERP